MGAITSKEREGVLDALNGKTSSLRFAQKCGKTFSNVEMWCLKENLGGGLETGDSLGSQEELACALGLPSEVAHLMYRSATALGAFPVRGQAEVLNLEALVKVLALADLRKTGQLVPADFNIVRFLFASFCELPEPKVDSSQESLPLFDDEELEMAARDLYVLITFLLVVFECQPFDRIKDHVDKVYGDQPTINQVRTSALCMVRAITPEVTSVSSLSDVTISWKRFQLAMLACYPYLFTPLSSVYNQLLYRTTHEAREEIKEEEGPSMAYSKLITAGTVPQLASFLGRENVFAKLVKLYVGAEAGFSMRAIETKVFKWNAPTILIVRGKMLDSDRRKSLSSRQRSFDEQIPAAKLFHEPVIKHSKVTFGVYLKRPWKASSKETFGDADTVLFQLAPSQDVYRHGGSAQENHFAFYCRSNPGPGGIGFGSAVPVKRKNPLLSNYHLGNVSLTLDESLEFGVFRHLGSGGTFNVSAMRPEEEFEDRFQITALEVWGCGGIADLEEQKKKWEWEEREAQYRQQVNIKNYGEERAFLEMAGLVGGEHRSGGSL
ncbi:restriction of telomere capping protein 5 [Trichomonascus vanleenenianus]|uniref:Rtc5p n=1 Tax=Trichomonascus vanleenenianus TaxID=2268995 RepID=UPI003EC99F4C